VAGLDRFERRVGVSRLGDHGDAADTIEDAAQSAPDELMVIAEHDPDRGLVGHVCTVLRAAAVAKPIGLPSS
jgi:hypothetical protein